MVDWCYLCDNKRNKEKNISLHKFPLDRPDISAKWLIVCGLSTRDDVSRTMICSCHFATSDFTSGSQRLRRLKPTAIPSINIPNNLQTMNCGMNETIAERTEGNGSVNFEDAESFAMAMDTETEVFKRIIVMGRNRCAVACCDNKIEGNGQLVFFSFPKDPALKKKWVKACRRRDKFNLECGKVCSAHFDECDFQNLMQIRFNKAKHLRLVKGALPTLKLKPDGYDDKPLSERERRFQEKQKKLEIEMILQEADTFYGGREDLCETNSINNDNESCKNFTANENQEAFVTSDSAIKPTKSSQPSQKKSHKYSQVSAWVNVNLNLFCRLCGKLSVDTNLISIFDSSKKIDNLTIMECINKYLPITACSEASENCTLPTRICIQCMNIINEWNAFYKRCRDTENLIHNSTLETEAPKTEIMNIASICKPINNTDEQIRQPVETDTINISVEINLERIVDNALVNKKHNQNSNCKKKPILKNDVNSKNNKKDMNRAIRKSTTAVYDKIDKDYETNCDMNSSLETDMRSIRPVQKINEENNCGVDDENINQIFSDPVLELEVPTTVQPDVIPHNFIEIECVEIDT